jgi:hypothetical protein
LPFEEVLHQYSVTMKHDLRAGLDSYLRAQQQRGLGDVRLASGRSLQPFSRGLADAATNLLIKAMRSLANGDPSRAQAFVERAVSLPFDEHERWSPAAAAGEQLLYDAVTDAVEESPEDDSAWLDAALHTLSHVGPHAAPVLREVLRSVPDAHELGKDERRRLRAGIADVPDQGELVDQSLSDEELTVTLIQVLEACNTYAAEFAARRP